MCTMVAGVVDVEVVMSKDAPGTGRGFCFVEFYNHSAAAHAKGVLGSETFRSGPTSSHVCSTASCCCFLGQAFHSCVLAS